MISETNLYEPRHKARLAIKPGITGMWQVSGRSDITDFEEVVRLDKEYIETQQLTIGNWCVYSTMKYHILLGDMFYRFGLIDVPDDAKEKMKRVNSSQTRRQDLREMLMEQIKDEPATVEYVHNFLTNREEK